jgi:hypothetical protein
MTCRPRSSTSPAEGNEQHCDPVNRRSAGFEVGAYRLTITGVQTHQKPRPKPFWSGYDLPYTCDHWTYAGGDVQMSGFNSLRNEMDQRASDTWVVVCVCQCSAVRNFGLRLCGWRSSALVTRVRDFAMVHTAIPLLCKVPAHGITGFAHGIQNFFHDGETL